MSKWEYPFPRTWGEVLEVKESEDGPLGLLLLVHIGEREIRRAVEVVSVVHTPSGIFMGEFDYEKGSLATEERLAIEAVATAVVMFCDGTYANGDLSDTIFIRFRVRPPRRLPQFSNN